MTDQAVRTSALPDAPGGELVSDLDRYLRDAPWRSDVALEMWIDVERCPVVVRLAGRLGGATSNRLVCVVSRLIADGHRDFALQTRDLDVSDTRGAEALMDLQRMITESGGRVLWDGPMSAEGRSA
jgi:hypothetical protein